MTWTTTPINGERQNVPSEIARTAGLLDVKVLLNPNRDTIEVIPADEISIVKALMKVKDLKKLKDKTFQTGEGRLLQALNCLKVFWDNKHIGSNRSAAIDIWFDIRDNIPKSTKEDKSSQNKKLRKLFRPFKDTWEAVNNEAVIENLFKMQLTDLHDRLPPLNFHPPPKKLDDFQLQALDYIDQKKSFMLCAPTSSGKTILTSYIASKKGKIMIIVPTDAVALQVFGNIQKSLGCRSAICCGTIYNVASSSEVIVGTPKILANHLVDLDVEAMPFSRVVLDEAHMMDFEVDMEYLSHILTVCGAEQMVLLSATIADPNALLEQWFKNLMPDAETIVVKKRYFNLNREVVTRNEGGELQLTPVSSMLALSGNDLIQEEVDPKLTSLDCVRVANQLEDILPEKLQIENWFKNRTDMFYEEKHRRITLGDVKQYEEVLMDTIRANPDVLDSLEFQFPECSTCEIEEILSLVCQDRKKLPMIVFNISDQIIKTLFYRVFQDLERRQRTEVPEYEKSLSQMQTKFRKEMKEYQKQLKKLKNPEQQANFTRDTPIPECPPSEESPHPDYMFSGVASPLTPDEVARELDPVQRYFNKKGQSETAYLLGELKAALCRGMALYLPNLPLEYLLYVQKLAQARRIPIIFSGMGLAHGINLPVKSTLLFGHPDVNDRWTTAIANQMEGRAGRRGIDRSGYIHYVNFPEQQIKEFMIGRLTTIRGVSAVNPALYALPLSDDKIIDVIHSVQNYGLQVCMGETDFVSIDFVEIDDRIKGLVWKLRHMKEGHLLGSMLLKWMSKRSRCSRTCDTDEVHLMSVILRLICRNPSLQDDDHHTELHELQLADLQEINTQLPPETIVDDLDEACSKLVYQVVKTNSLSVCPRGLRENLVDTMAEVRDTMLICRNEFCCTPMEELLRKAWRRLFWITTTGCIQMGDDD